MNKLLLTLRRFCWAILAPLLFPLVARAAAPSDAPKKPIPPRMLPALTLSMPGVPQSLDLGDYYPNLKKIERLAPALAALPVRAEIEVTTSSFDARPTVLRAQIQAQPARPEFSLVEAALRFDDGGSDTAVILLRKPAVPLTQFRFKPLHPGVREVMLTGAFNNWQPGATPMRGPALDGTFRAELPLEPGSYAYQFLADDVPYADLENPPAEENAQSVIDVEESVRDAPPLLPVPAFGTHTTDTAQFSIAEGTLRAAFVLGGNRLAGRAVLNQPTPPAPAGTIKVSLARNSVTLNGLAQTDGLSREGALHILALTDTGAWTEATLQRRPPLDGGLVYQIVTDRFADGDPSSNRPLRTPGLSNALDWHGGDWAGIRAKIESGYFEKLGVGTLTISPPDLQADKAEPCAALGGALSSAFRGFWPVSNEATEPRFGTAGDLKALVTAAHKHRLRVLLELNANHVHWDHLWRRRWPEYINKLKSPDGLFNVRQFDAAPQTTWEEAFLPDIGYDQDPNATAKMVDAALAWLRRSGADGFRHERPSRVPREFWSALTRRLEAENVKRTRPYLQLADADSGPSAFPFDTVQEARLLRPLITTLALQSEGLEALARPLDAAFDSGASAGRMRVESLGLPDLPRLSAFVPQRAQGDRGKTSLRLALSLLYTLPGAPGLLYGEEIGLRASGPAELPTMRFGDDLSAEGIALIDLAADMARLRDAHAALTRGSYQLLHVETDRLAFARVAAGLPDAPDQALMILLNREADPRPMTVPLPFNLQAARQARPLSFSGSPVSIRGNQLIVSSLPHSVMIWELY